MAKLWKEEKILDAEEAQDDFRRWGKRSEMVIELALEMEQVELGGQFRCVFDTEAVAKRAQGNTREAAELAGWYDTIDNNDEFMTFKTSIKNLGVSGHMFKVQRLKRPRRTVRRKSGKTNPDTD